MDLNNDADNWRRGFEPNIGNLLRAIDNERGFKERPIGPVGRYIKLLKPEWASVVENTLGATLSSFVVTCKDDQNLLSKLMSKTSW